MLIFLNPVSLSPHSSAKENLKPMPHELLTHEQEPVNPLTVPSSAQESVLPFFFPEDSIIQTPHWGFGGA